MAIYVNFEGLNTVNEELENKRKEFDSAMESLQTLVKETTLNDWKGSDANTFVTNTTEKVNKVLEEYNDFYNNLKEEIRRNNEKFQSVQTQNMNMMG